MLAWRVRIFRMHANLLDSDTTQLYRFMIINRKKEIKKEIKRKKGQGHAKTG